MNLFDIEMSKDFLGEFKVTLNQSLYISDDIFAAKEQGKRVLLEMVDTHPKLILGYSGGMDTGFILCCICLLYTSPSPRDKRQPRMPSSA